MKKPYRAEKSPPPRFHIGDRVRVLHGWPGALGEVVEDRGNLGSKGERIYAVRMRLDQWNDMTTEFHEESLEVAATA